MGTGGCLRLIEGMNDDLLIINGDVLTQLDYEMFYGFHIKSKSAVTVAASQYNFIVPYGVIEQQNLQVIALEEKPNYSFLVNSGIYFISPDVFQNLPSNAKFNMTDVIDGYLKIGGQVSCFPIFEKWLDIGQPSDYFLANNFL
jgi:NDP-sugar pyrophosphorylase family protein